MASIQKRPDGVWRARYRDETGREKSRHFKRKIDAQKWLDEITASVVTGTYVDPKAGKVTLASYFAQWSERQVWETGTTRSMGLAVRTCTFTDVELGKLRRSHVETWIKSMVKAGLMASTIKTRVRNVRAVLRGAVSDKVIGTDPSVGVALPRLRKADAAMVIPTPDEVGTLMTAIDPWFRPMMGLCAFAGLRIGEAVAVQLGDIDFLRRTLTVSRQVQSAKGGREVRLPKYGSERTVHLPDELVLMLSERVQNVGVFGEEGWLFGGRFGGSVVPVSVSSMWIKARKAVGLDHVKVHSLRHYFASGLIASGCDVVTVQRALGHAKATTTLDTYSHLWPTAEDRTRTAAGELMRVAMANLADSQRTEHVSRASD